MVGRYGAVGKVVQVSLLVFGLLYLLRRSDMVQKESDGHVSSWLASNPTNGSKTPAACDPYGEPGHLFTADNLHDSRYIIYNDQRQTNSDSPDQDWVVPSLTAAIHEHKFVDLDFLRNRSVLMIGDSIDRNLATHFGRTALQGTAGYHTILNPPESSHIVATKLSSHQVGVSHLPELNFSIANWFLMGVGVQDEVAFYHPREDLPQEFERRLETFFFPLLKARLLPKPDLITYNSGLWDLEYLARTRMAKYNLPDIQPRTREAPASLALSKLGDGSPLSLTELAYHRARLRRFLKVLIKFIHELYGDHHSSVDYKNSPIEIMYRSMHLGNSTITNAFAPERIHQIDESNRLVAKEFNIKVFEWGKMTTGLHTQLSDPIPSIHFGDGSAQYIFGDMLLFYLKRLYSGAMDEWIGCDWIRNRRASQHPGRRTP